ncbi:MAG: Crp/Fnr family transcriptional regulator [Sphingobacteriaceae bacterium]|nr:MAG: Crp/Fnr family transcriptional regulator [Sphingobacteriaceae bacterium]
MENSTYHQITNAFIRCGAVSVEDMEEILQHLSVTKLGRNDYFSKQGSVCKKIGFLNSGMIRHFYPTNENEVTRWISFPNDFVTSLKSFILQSPTIENLQAITDCELVIFDKEAFNALITKNQSFKNFYIKALEYNYTTIEDRVFSLIEKSAEERFKWMSENQLRIIQQVPVMYTASMLGITPRHLSRLRRKFYL